MLPPLVQVIFNPPASEFGYDGLTFIVGSCSNSIGYTNIIWFLFAFPLFEQ